MKLIGNRSNRRNALTQEFRGRRKLMLLSAVASAAAGSLLPMQNAQAGNDAYDTAPTAVSTVYNFSNNFTLGTTTPAPSGTGTPASGDALYFGTNTAGTIVNDDQPTTDSFAGITFNAGASAFTIGGNSFTLSGAITNNSTNLQTINDAITVATAQAINPFAGSISLGGTITDSAALAISGPNAIAFAGTGDSLTGLTLGVPQTNTSVNTNTSATNIVGVTANINSSATVGPLLVASGGNVINVGAGATITNTTIGIANTSDRVTLLNVNLGGGSAFTTNATNTNGVIVIGSQYNLLTLNGTDFAANSTNAAGGSLVPATYTTLAATGNSSTQNSNVTSSVAITGSTSMNTLRFAPTGSGSTVTLTPGQTLSLNATSNGGGTVLMPATAGAVTNTITGGTLIGSSNRGAAFLNYDTTTGSNLQISSNFDNYILSGSGASGTAVVVVGGGGTVTFGGTNFINGTLYIDSSTLSAGSDSNLGAVNGTVSVTTATNGSTAVTLTSANTNTSGLAVGDVLLGQVITVISSNGAGTTVTLASAYTGTSIASPTTVGFVGGGAIDLNGSTLLASSTFSLGETNNTGSAATGLSTTFRNRNLGLGLKGGTIDVTASNSLTIPGVISSSTGATATIGALNKVDSGTLTIAGSANNTGLFLNQMAGTTALGNSSGYSANVVTVSGGTLTFASGAPNNQDIGTSLTINGGTFDLAGGNAIYTTMLVLNGTGGTITNSSASSNAVLYIGNSGTTYTDSLPIASNIIDGASKNIAVNVQGNLTGARTILLSGVNTYSGATTINGASILAGSTSALSPNSAFTLANGTSAGISLSGFNNTIGSLAGGGTTGGNIDLGNATLTTGNTGTGTTVYAGVISGTGGLTKIGAGNQSLTGANTFCGPANVNGGTLTIDATANASAALVNASTVNVSTGATLHLINTAASSATSMLNSASAVTISGSGTQVVVDLNGQVQAVGSFIVGTTNQGAGYFGSAAFFAANPSYTDASGGADDAYFGGTGGLDVVPEPTAACLVGWGCGLALLRRRRKISAIGA